MTVIKHLGFKLSPAVALMGLSLVSSLAYGHHSQSYFTKEFTQLNGEIVKVEWRNPHIRFELRTTNSKGEQEIRRIETNSIYYLERAGVTKNRINVGDRVVIGGYASIKAGGEFLAANMRLADGETAEFIRDAVTEQFKDKLVNAAAENKGFFRVWSIPQKNDRVVTALLTQEAAQKKAKFDLLNNFTSTCEPVGMPRLMWYPHPYAFEKQGSNILLRTEMYDAVRTIHMEQSVVPNIPPRSLMGYSVGRWQDGVLIVETTGIDWNYFDTQGTPQSPAAKVVERFTLSKDQSRLDYHIVTTDPATFTEPATITGYWLALGEKIKPYNCQVY